jgi:hypothetical protein
MTNRPKPPASWPSFYIECRLSGSDQPVSGSNLLSDIHDVELLRDV